MRPLSDRLMMNDPVATEEFSTKNNKLEDGIAL